MSLCTCKLLWGYIRECMVEWIVIPLVFILLLPRKEKYENVVDDSESVLMRRERISMYVVVSVLSKGLYNIDRVWCANVDELIMWEEIGCESVDVLWLSREDYMRLVWKYMKLILKVLEQRMVGPILKMYEMWSIIV